jgi:hypothetical protein
MTSGKPTFLSAFGESFHGASMEGVGIGHNGRVVRRRRLVLCFWALRYSAVVLAVLVGLLVPVIVLSNNSGVDSTATSTSNNLIWWIFFWLFFSWLVACCFDIFALALPYFFRFCTR